MKSIGLVSGGFQGHEREVNRKKKTFIVDGHKIDSVNGFAFDLLPNKCIY